MTDSQLSKLAHAGLFPLGNAQLTVTPPMEATTFIFDKVDQLLPISQASLATTSSQLYDALYYGGIDTPTTRQLAMRLAALEKGNFTTLSSSGQCAINLLLTSLLSPGDHLLAGDTTIYSTQWLFNHFKKYGIDVEYFTPSEAPTLKRRLRPATKLVFFENPGSFTYEIIDTTEIVKSCNGHPAIIVVDNTWAASTFQFPLELGADVSLISLSKSHAAIEGISLGAIITTQQDIYTKTKTVSALIGNHVGSHACSAALRSLSSLGARLNLQMHTTKLVLQHLKSMPLIKTILHPSLQNSQAHLMHMGITGYNSLITVEFTCSEDELIARLNLLSLIKIGHGWGGAISLVSLVDMSAMSSAKRFGVSHTCARFYLGLEDSYELIQDLQNAFQK